MGLAMEHTITVTMGHLTTSPALPWPTRHHGTTRFLFRWTDIISRCERTMLAGNSRPSSPSPVYSPVLTFRNHSERRKSYCFEFFYDWAVATTKYPQKVQYRRLGGVGWTDHRIVTMIFLLLQHHFLFYDLKACHLGHLSTCVVTVK